MFERVMKRILLTLLVLLVAGATYLVFLVAWGWTPVYFR